MCDRTHTRRTCNFSSGAQYKYTLDAPARSLFLSLTRPEWVAARSIKRCDNIILFLSCPPSVGQLHPQQPRVLLHVQLSLSAFSAVYKNSSRSSTIKADFCFNFSIQLQFNEICLQILNLIRKKIDFSFGFWKQFFRVNGFLLSLFSTYLKRNRHFGGWSACYPR